MSTPHKCPCCDGWGKRVLNEGYSHLHIGYEEVICAACHGNGVVWSPDSVFIPSCRPVGEDWPDDVEANSYTVTSCSVDNTE